MNEIPAAGMVIGVRGSASERGAIGRRITILQSSILLAFHASCDIRDLEVAKRMLATLTSASVSSADQSDDKPRHAMELIVAAHERLWLLAHPEAAAGLL